MKQDQTTGTKLEESYDNKNVKGIVGNALSSFLLNLKKIKERQQTQSI